MTPTPSWLQEKLFERRIVFVTGGLDDALAAQAAAQIMTLDASSDAPIDVVLSSADGTLEAAFALIDVIDAAHAPIRIRCQGQVGGPAIGVVAAADQRSASAHTTFRLSLPAVCSRRSRKPATRELSTGAAWSRPTPASPSWCAAWTAAGTARPCPSWCAGGPA